MSDSKPRAGLADTLGLADPGTGGTRWSRLFIKSPRPTTPRSRPAPAVSAAAGLAADAGAPERGFVLATIRWLGIDLEAVGGRLEAWGRQRWVSSPLVRWLAFALAAFIFWITISTPMGLLDQTLLFLMLWWMALVIRRVPGHVPTLVLILFAMLGSCRYGWWRVHESMDLEPGWETGIGWVLLAAEVYAFLIMVLGFVQSARPLRRQTMPMPEDRSTWPVIDVLIPTYHEPLSVVEPTVLAARSMDWPADKLNIYVLDDGRRDELRDFAAAAGVNYLRREGNLHAKAGNLNNALGRSQGEFVAFFDCDHMPTRTFLTATMGWLLRDRGCAMVQTPQHFFSPDPFERNLDTFRRVPNEGKLFYGVVQDGNDFWNATFFCGSCAVVRRSALEEIGGVATDTVTEDAHTALRLHRRGHTTAYINETHAAGLATESLSQHIAQRTRWARGMAQIFRVDNPLLGRGLSLVQRLCYSNAMLHFFYGLPRLVFLTAPLAYLFFELHIIRASALTILAYALPHIVLPHIANAHINGPHRHNFWAEVYETVLAWYVALPTTLAFLNPRLGRFNVTAKGGLVEREHFDWRISRPYLVLVLLNVIGACVGVARLVWWNTFETGTVLLNLVWTVYNLTMLGAAIGVARERRQVRTAPRVAGDLPIQLQLDSDTRIAAVADDYSLGGLGVRLGSPLPLQMGDKLVVALRDAERTHEFPVEVSSLREGRLGLAFAPLDIDQRAALIRCTLGRADAWSNWQLGHDVDHASQGLQEITLLAVRSYRNLLSAYVDDTRDAARRAGASWRAWLSSRARRTATPAPLASDIQAPS